MEDRIKNGFKIFGIGIITALVIITSIYLEGCTEQETTLGGDEDAHGCILSAGYSWCELKQKCLRPFEEQCEEYCSKENGGERLNLSRALQIAESSECGAIDLKTECGCPEGYILEGESCNPECYYIDPGCLIPSLECQRSYFCNEETGTWWIDLEIKKQGCAPACIIDVNTKKAEINWRCTGLVQDD